MVVVALVVIVMELPDDFGDKVGSIEWTLGRSEKSNNDTNVSQQINCSDIDGVESNSEYGVRMSPRGGNEQPFVDPVFYTVRTYQDRARFTVPFEYIKQCNLEPGHTVQFTLYECRDDQVILRGIKDLEQVPNEKLYEILSSAMSNLGKAQTQIQTVRSELNDRE